MDPVDLRQDDLLLCRDPDLEDADQPDMVHDDLLPDGLLLSRDPDLLLGVVVVEEDADRPDMVHDDLRPDGRLSTRARPTGPARPWPTGPAGPRPPHVHGRDDGASGTTSPARQRPV